MIKRDRLQEMRFDAEAAADIPHLNPSWKRAYERLADACDHLDAMMARCTVREDQAEAAEAESDE